MSSSNCCFLTCIQISQEAGQVIWYSHLFQNFPQFIVIHTVKEPASVRSMQFLPFIVPVFAWKVLIFLKRSLVFPILFFSSISLHWSLRKTFLYFLAILWNSAFKWVYLSFSPLPLLLFFSLMFLMPPQTTILPFCISFSWGWSWSLPSVQCHEPQSIVHQALCLSDLVK